MQTLGGGVNRRHFDGLNGDSIYSKRSLGRLSKSAESRGLLWRPSGAAHCYCRREVTTGQPLLAILISNASHTLKPQQLPICSTRLKACGPILEFTAIRPEDELERLETGQKT